MEKVKTGTTQYCEYLMAKNHFGTIEGGGNPWFDINDSNSICVCVKTMGHAGPDNSLVDPVYCKSGRSCYTAPVK